MKPYTYSRCPGTKKPRKDGRPRLCPVCTDDLKHALVVLDEPRQHNHAARRLAWKHIRDVVRYVLRHVAERDRSDTDWRLIELWAGRMKRRVTYRTIAA
jgi:hypothetical protein